MKFNVVLVLWGLLIGYVAYHDGSLNKLAQYVNLQTEPTKSKRSAAHSQSVASQVEHKSTRR